MDIEKEVREIVFQIGKEIKIHKIDSDNSIIEIDYDKYINAIIDIINKRGNFG